MAVKKDAENRADAAYDRLHGIREGTPQDETRDERLATRKPKRSFGRRFGR